MADDDPAMNDPFGPDADLLRNAWQETMTDLKAMVEARQEQGWDALGVPAGDVAPEHQAVGDTDKFGLTFTIPDSYAFEFEDSFRRGSYPEYEVYRKTVEGRVFLVVEYRDPKKELMILVAGAYEVSNAHHMVEDAIEKGEFFTHHQEVDGTHLGTFHHDSHEKFVPEDELPERLIDVDGGGDDADDGA